MSVARESGGGVRGIKREITSDSRFVPFGLAARISFLRKRQVSEFFTTCFRRIIFLLPFFSPSPNWKIFTLPQAPRLLSPKAKFSPFTPI